MTPDQIEEALKLYQNALKLHSQGPDFYPEAEAAYQALFNSEIFTYPESTSLSKQIDLYDDVDESNDITASHDLDLVDLPAASADEAPNTLNQILFLAYKNRGQYLLDRLKHDIECAEKGHGRFPALDLPKVVRETVIASLKCLVEAVDRDDTDPQLWRLISRLGYFLKSKRIARFCLEAALDDDGDGIRGWPEPQGLEESFAAEQLQSLLRELGDTASETHSSMGTKRQLLSSLKKLVDPCPFLPNEEAGSKNEHKLARLYEKICDRHTISVPVRNWASVGKAILLQAKKISQWPAEVDVGTAYELHVPPRRASQGSNVVKNNLATGTAALASPTTKFVLRQEVNARSSENPGDDLHGEFSPTMVSDRVDNTNAQNPPDELDFVPAAGVEGVGGFSRIHQVKTLDISRARTMLALTTNASTLQSLFYRSLPGRCHCQHAKDPRRRQAYPRWQTRVVQRVKGLKQGYQFMILRLEISLSIMKNNFASIHKPIKCCLNLWVIYYQSGTPISWAHLGTSKLFWCRHRPTTVTRILRTTP